MIELRDYQKLNSDIAANNLEEYNIAYLAMETRTGKTITALEACRKFGAKKILFVTKKKAISSIENDALNFPKLEVIVINYESVLKKIDDYDLIVCDESHSCFVGSTLIDGIEIKDIKFGSSQKSFNFTKNIISDNKVINKFKKELTSDLVKIRCNNKEIICTENHLIYTKDGYKKAKEITPNDELLVMQ